MIPHSPLLCKKKALSAAGLQRKGPIPTKKVPPKLSPMPQLNGMDIPFPHNDVHSRNMLESL